MTEQITSLTQKRDVIHSAIRYTDAPFLCVNDAKIEFDVSGRPILPPEILTRARSQMPPPPIKNRKAVRRLSIAIHDERMHHYFHFLETFLTLYAAQQEFFPEAEIDEIIVGESRWNNPLHANVQHETLSLFYPSAKIADGQLSGPLAVDNLLYIDRRLTKTRINKMMDPILPLVRKWAPKLRATIYNAIGLIMGDRGVLEPPATRIPRLLYVKRNRRRTLAPDAERKLLDILRCYGHVDIVEFQGMSWTAQVRTAASHDLIIGVHGNGLSNLLWLPKHATVIELFPKRVHHYDYQMMAEIMNLSYFGIEGDHIFREYARCGPPYSYRGGGAASVTNFKTSVIVSALNKFRHGIAS